MIRVLLVDDQKMVREAVRISLEPEPDLEVVGTADNGLAAIEQVQKLRPDVVVMNMEMPILDGADATQKITKKFADTKVLMLTSYDSDDYIAKCLAVGAKGYLLKSRGTQDVAPAIRNIYQGYTQIAPGLLDKLLVYTDCGIILSKLKGSVYNPTKSEPHLKQTISRPQKTIANLQSTTRQQQAEINQLRINLHSNQQELPKIKQGLLSHTRYIWTIGALWLLSFSLVFVFLLELYNKTNKIQISAIPTERIGLYGEFSLNGIAERVSKAFKQDPIVGDISTVYVAQEDDAIILTGTISDPNLLRRMENIAKQISGVNKVYSSQVAIKQGLNQDFLGSER